MISVLAFSALFFLLSGLWLARLRLRSTLPPLLRRAR